MPAEQRAGATPHARATYLPLAPEERRGIVLCLSGGGFRAALFHLGGLRRLNELGALGRIDAISSVSGGSILAAHLAERLPVWPQPGDVVTDWEERVAGPFRTFVGRNHRTLPLLTRLLPWNWLRPQAAALALAGRYRRHLTGLSLGQLPERPRYLLNATDVVFGARWVFDSGPSDGGRGRAGDEQAGYTSSLPDWPLARAVAASGCFPPVFDPLPAGIPPDDLRGGAYRKEDRDALVRQIGLSDGGLVDNHGLEAVWQTFETLLVSDGGGVLEPERDTGPWWRLQRYVTIAHEQGGRLRKRWLISSFIGGLIQGTYWGVSSAAAHYGDYPGYSDALADEVISEIRTDLDAFSAAEAAVLENHGYLLAEAAIGQHAPHLIGREAPPATPHPAWMDEARVRAALKDSHRVRLLGRLGRRGDAAAR